MITVQLARPWHLKTPELFRYLDRTYIAEFFDTGRLRLSSFHQFAHYADEQRADAEEGHNVLVGRGQEHTVIVATQHGHKSLILSTSTVWDERLTKTFKTDGCFCIKNSMGFGAAVANRIPGFLEGIEGFCIYAEQRMIQRRLNSSLDDLKVPEGNSVSLNNAFALAAQIGAADVLFVKHSRFRHQSEYRIVWNVPYDVEDAIFVECPEAIQFCEKVT